MSAREAFEETRLAWLNHTGREPHAITLPTRAYLQLAWELGLRDPRFPVRVVWTQLVQQWRLAGEQPLAEPFLGIENLSIGPWFIYNGVKVTEGVE